MAEHDTTEHEDTAEAAPAGEPGEPVELPQRFFGGFRLGLAVGGATLVVGEGTLRLYPDGTAQAAGAEPVEHTKPTVTVFLPRWQPPSSNTGVLLEDEGSERIALADLPGWQRARLRSALAAAGFALDEQRTPFDIGRSRVRPSASPWPRWLERRWSEGDVPPRR